MKKIFIAIYSFLMFLVSCATNVAVDNKAVLNLLVRQAVVRAINGDKAKAVRVKEILAQTRAVVEGQEGVSVGLLMTVLREHIKMDNLKPEDQILISDILSLIQIDIEKQLGEGILSPEQKVFVSELLLAAEQAASMV